ncbi:hypothetical protein K438DRAFT_1990120 [Mycena galopus ATCC 62051]|nr:hypothetical protein K438DRAFT_1990120 [Mycena galopus ATCC 62051]
MSLDNGATQTGHGLNIEDDVKAPLNAILAALPDSTVVDAIQTLSTDWPIKMQDPAEAAVQGMTVLTRSIEALSKVTEDPEDALVKKCKGQAVELKKRFMALYATAAELLNGASNDATDLTEQITTMQKLQQRWSTQLTIVKTTAAGLHTQLDTLNQALSTAQSAVGSAQNAVDTAQRKVNEAIRASLSFWSLLQEGFGVHDPAGKEGADNALAAAFKVLEASQTSAGNAQDAVNVMARKIYAGARLTQALGALGTIMDSDFGNITTLMSTIVHVQSMTLKVSTSLGSLVGEAVGVLQFDNTARSLAQCVLEIQNTIQTTSELTGVFVDDPESMDATLKKIADSKAPPDPYADLNLT